MTEPAHDDEDHYGPRDQKRLRLVHCAECEAKDRKLQSIGIDYDNLITDLKAKNRVIGQLKGELAAERREGAFHVEAQAIFEFWKKRISPGARAFGDDRLKVVLARLNQKKRTPGQKRATVYPYSPRYICEAIHGASLDPKPWYDLKWICKGSGNLEQCHDFYKAWRWPGVGVAERARLYDEWVEAGRP